MTSADHDGIDELKAFALRLAQAARGQTLPRLGGGSVEDKSGAGDFDPVTEADRAAERAMRNMIEEGYPDHGITGEEYPDRPSSSRFCWSLDPIDGTRSFICGLPTWTTLIALLDDGVPILGVIDAPRLGELYIGDGRTASLVTDGNDRRIAASGCTRLSEARLSTTDPFLFSGPDAARFACLRLAARTTRYGHDGYGYARLAAGTIDLVVESGLKPHDYNALVPIVRGSGGVIGNWRGEDDFTLGAIVAAATPALFEEAVALLGA